MLTERQELQHIRLKSKLKMQEELLLPKLLVLKLKREWKRSAPLSNSELRRNRLREKLK